MAQLPGPELVLAGFFYSHLTPITPPPLGPCPTPAPPLLPPLLDLPPTPRNIVLMVGYFQNTFPDMSMVYVRAILIVRGSAGVAGHERPGH